MIPVFFLSKTPNLGNKKMSRAFPHGIGHVRRSINNKPRKLFKVAYIYIVRAGLLTVYNSNTLMVNVVGPLAPPLVSTNSAYNVGARVIG